MFFRRKRQSRKIFINNKGYPVYKDSGIPAHIRAAEKKVGGKIYPSRVVHHIDGDKTNYRQDNLQVMSRSAHSKLHSRLKYQEKRSTGWRLRKRNCD